eukprot:CAMPEP_0119069548 /NCGR_PEP_ID=MMETSP1178-20130426/24300_1 /TAXON_ID=33656 /ORGANISM="unid sp, Strain CCMP2000" /LENGTH=35 /DNA_ID= /DNA_START= /DNA_END= /DNA_ORIENTATION=
MMIPTCGDDGSHVSKVYQELQQVALAACSMRRETQ